MVSPIYTKTYEAPPVNRKEIFRYMRAGEITPALEQLVDECLLQALPLLTYRVCWRRFSILQGTDQGLLPFDTLGSQDCEKCLQGAEEGILFAATVGLSMDRLLARYSAMEPSRALCMQGIGAERIESLCDRFCADVGQETGRSPGPRYSPGYGDLPLTVQKEIFTLLDCPGRIGLTLTNSLLMSPTKSVTAFFGLFPAGACRGRRGCAACEKNDCVYRRNP